MAYQYKVWIADGKEHFEYGNKQKKKKDLPFGTSLMELLYLDAWAYGELFDGIGKAIMDLYSSKEQRYADEVVAALDMVVPKHIYFELLRLEWQERLGQAKRQNYENIVDLLPHKELTHIPSNLHTMQEQIKTLFAHVLDLDTSPKESVQKKMVRYYNYRGSDRLNTFQFQPQPMSFEVIDRKTFTEVLYPKNIYDIIDYFVRECVKREHPMRICKNCGRYFAISGRTDAEYCNRSIDDKGRTCKDMGAINLWNEKRKDDEVFKVYRREYKKRFGWIKAGKIEQEDFYAWSEKAREEKARCDSGEISLQEFTEWLGR
ncbi:hypothetical protein DFR58_11574 [Anaerobacterium chartisolvens]|uniref:Uncharacterized protein n=1 Tax=Anaerobacterium chartisolvens TaxID=1297424 RepID=A0A369AY55_9FIRM|nr:DUF6076 domain-containing protein [Anaerobacterium chartisolvens]RCX14350.1 hypothetical protein DFR58_11574 [Anaerobacterium chartisolvens]